MPSASSPAANVNLPIIVSSIARRVRGPWRDPGPVHPYEQGTWGPPERERRNHGNSLVADPWGRVVAEASDGVGVTLAELDLTQVGRVRGMLPALRHRRLFPSC